MNGKFRHYSEKLMMTGVLIFLVLIAVCLITVLGLSAETTELFWIIIIMCEAADGIVMIYSRFVKGSFEAREKDVTFKLGTVQYNIAYADIENISCKAEKVQVSSKEYDYRVILTIKTKDKTYTFNDKIKTTDKEFKDNKSAFYKKKDEHDFSRLCTYVKKHKGQDV